jgi:hypothetical protein
MLKMSRIRHKNHMPGAKRVLAVLMGLILFTAQLSYRFYVLSSQPVFNAAAQKAASPSYPGTGILHDHNHAADLSLDKRYNFQKTFALWVPIFRIDLPPIINKGKIPEWKEELPVSSLTAHPALRGPPCA